MCVYIYVCVCVCIYIYVCVCIYIYGISPDYKNWNMEIVIQVRLISGGRA